MPTRTAGDFTGKKADALANEHAAELKARASQISTIVQADIESKDDVIEAHPIKPAVVVDEVSSVVTVDGDPFETVRLAEDVQQITVGRDTYDFVANQRYKVPANVAFVLREKGKLWDRG
jgi:hypothetical protein